MGNDIIHDYCWYLGKYTDKCDCNTCIHRDECSGSEEKENKEET